MDRTSDRISLGRPNVSDEEIAAAERVLRSRWLVLGPENRAFEEELAAYCGRRFAAVVSSGTAALHLALLARSAAPSSVLVPAFTFPATASVTRFLPSPPALYLGDVDAGSFCLPAATVKSYLDSPLAGEEGLCISVHQFGFPSPLPASAGRAEPRLLSDAACAIGVRGAMAGQAVCLSFHPRKLLTTGEGGAVLSDDESFIEEVRRLRAHSLVARPGAEVMELPRCGLNYRLPEMGAAMGRVQLRRLPGFIERHREIAAHYRHRLGQSGLAERLQADHPERIYQTLALVLPEGTDRLGLRQALLQQGIETQIASYGLHRLAAFADARVLHADGSTSPVSAAALPVSDRLHELGLALPLHSELRLAEVDRVCDALLGLLSSAA